MNRLLRFLKIALRWLAYILGFTLVATVLLALFAGFTAPGARFVAMMIEKYASTPDQIVRINDPSALLTGDFTASSVTLFDSKGIYAEIREVGIHWSPTALFSSRFEAAKLSAGSVRLERLPIPSQETREVRETFALPLDIKIDAFDLKEVVIGKEIAGADQFLSAQGKVNATNASIAAALAVAQRDRPDAKAIADIVFNPAGNELKLETTINEPKGGLLAKAMRLPGEPALTVSVTGDGPLSKWKGSATAALDGNQVLKLDGEHTLAPDGFRTVALHGGGTFSDLLPAVFRPLFAGTTEIDLAAAIDGGKTVRIDKGNISTGALALTASGTYSTAGQNDLQASLTGKTAPIDFRLPLAEGEAQLSINSANVSLIGDAQTAVLDIGADIGKATLPQGEIDAINLHAYSDTFNLSTRTGPLKAEIRTGATRFVNSDIDRLVKGPVKLDGTLSVTPETVSFDPVTLESASVGGTLTGSYTITEGTVASAFKLFALPATLPPGIASKFDTTIAIAGNLATGSDNSVKVTDLTLASGTVEAAGSVTLQTGDLTATLSGTVPEIGKLLADAKGVAKFSADVTGPLDALAVKAEVTSSGATLAGRTLNDLAVNADATIGKNGPNATISATGSLDGQTIDAKTEIASAKGATSIPSIDVTIGENKLTGALDLTADFQPNGTLTFNLPDLGLLAAMAGQTASGDLAGSASIKTDNGVTSVAVKANGSGITRGDLVITKPAADITIADLKALAIKGNVTVESVAQGETRLAGLKLGFEQQGALTNFALDGAYDAAPLTARGDLQSAGKTTINLQSFAAAPKKIPLELAAPTTIVIENGVVQLSRLAVKASGGTVTLDGSAGETLDLTAALAGIDARVPLQGGEAHLVLDSGTASIKGTMQAAALDVKADLTQLALPQGRFEGVKLAAHSDVFNLTARSGAVATTIETGATQLTNADLDRLVKGPVKIATTLDVTPEAIGFSPVTIASTNLDGALAGSVALADNAVRTTFKLSAKPAALPPAAAAKFDAPVEITGRLVTGPQGAVDVTDLKIASGTIRADGSVSLKEQNLTAALTGSLPDLGKVLADAKGAAEFKIDATGPLDNLGVKANVTSSGATLAGRTLSDLQLAVDATANPANPQAKVTATGALGGQAINVNADLVSRDGRTSIPVLQAQIGENTLKGAIDFTTDFLPQGAIDFTFPDVGLLAAMAGEKASGDIAGSVSITSAGGKTAIALKASGSGIKRGDLVITKPVADINIADLKTLAIKGNLSVEAFAQGQNRVNGLKLDFVQQAAKTNVTLGGTYDGAPVNLKADIQTNGGKTVVNLASFAASPRKIPLKLSAPTVITIENGTVGLQKLAIGASGGSIAVTGTAGEKLDLSVDLNALPAKLANTFSPSLGADGAISGTVGVKGTAAAPAVTYDLRWANAGLAQTRSAGVGALDITAKGQFANNTVRLDTTLRGPSGLAFQGGGTLGITGNRPISMKFSGELPFGLGAALLASQGFTLTGSANVDVSISGAATAPVITGTISTAGARLVDVRHNLAITDLTANVALNGQQANISKLSGRLASGGSLDVSGTIGTAPGSGFPADLSIRLDNATYVDGNLVTASVDGAMTLKGSLTTTPILGGTVTIQKAAITIPEKLPASLSEINIKHKNAPAKVRQMQADVRKDQGGGDGAGGGGGIGFDLTVSAPGKLFVRGRGIDAELGGDLTIRGTAAQPAVSGGFEMRRGRLEILAKRLNFTDGTITFGGNLIPTLDLDATSSAGTTTITVNVAGVANNPAITFSSSPALPQDEILAQLIFNRSLSKLSALQIAQLASAVSELAGGGSNGLLNGLRNKLGVDDLDVSTDATGGATVTAGKYINERTYLELQSGSESGGGKAIINLDVGRGVKLRGEAGSSGAGGGIFYEKEY